MSSKEYMGMVVIEIDGIEYDCEKFGETEETGRKAVKHMSRTGKSNGYTEGCGTIELSISVIVPLSMRPPNWARIKDATITRSPLNDPSQRTTWTGCYTTKTGMTSSHDSETKTELTMMANERFEE
jgi:hypothetical protein